MCRTIEGVVEPRCLGGRGASSVGIRIGAAVGCQPERDSGGAYGPGGGKVPRPPSRDRLGSRCPSGFFYPMEELISLSDMITRSGCSAGTIFLDASVEKPDPWLREQLKLEPGEMVFRLEQVRTANGKPVVYCLDKFPASMAEDFHPCESDFLFQLFEKAGRRVVRARTRVEAIGYHERISSLLCSPPESSLLILRQLHYDGQDRPVLFSSHYFRSDQFSFQVERYPPGRNGCEGFGADRGKMRMSSFPMQGGQGI